MFCIIFRGDSRKGKADVENAATAHHFYTGSGGTGKKSKKHMKQDTYDEINDYEGGDPNPTNDVTEHQKVTGVNGVNNEYMLEPRGDENQIYNEGDVQQQDRHSGGTDDTGLASNGVSPSYSSYHSNKKTSLLDDADDDLAQDDVIRREIDAEIDETLL